MWSIPQNQQQYVIKVVCNLLSNLLTDFTVNMIQAYASLSNYFLVELQWGAMKQCKYSNLVIVKELAGPLGLYGQILYGCNLNNEAIMIKETQCMTVNPMTNTYISFVRLNLT